MLTEKQVELMNKASDITTTDYEVVDATIEPDMLLECIYDLVWEIGDLKNTMQEIIDDRDNNYEYIADRWE